MKNSTKLLIVAAVISCVLTQCTCHKPDPTPPKTYTYNSSRVVFDTNAIAFQTQTYNVADSSGTGPNDSVITFSKGTQLMWKDSSFMFNGGWVQHAKFIVKEMYKNSDWIFSNMQTVDSGRRWMQSFGAIYIAVVDDYGDTCDVDPTVYVPSSTSWLNRATFLLRVPATANGAYDQHAYFGTPRMVVYNEDFDSLNTLTPLTYPDYNWWTATALQFIYPQNAGPFYYTVVMPNLLSMHHWYNLADSNAKVGSTGTGLYKGQATGTITLQNATSPSYEDVQIFFVADAPYKVCVIKAMKSVLNGTQYVIPNVPLNITGKIVAWNVSAGKQLYANYKVNTDGTGSFLSVNPKTANTTATMLYYQVTIDDLTKYIKALD